MKYTRLFSIGFIMSINLILAHSKGISCNTISHDEKLISEESTFPILKKREEENLFENIYVDIQNYKLEVMLRSEEILKWQKRGYGGELKKLPDYFHHAIKEGDEEGKGSLFMGWLYHMGIGIDQDDEMALKFYNLSIEKGNSTAMNNAANIYLFGGREVVQNFYISLELYKRAVKGENIRAIHNLADWYFCGIGIDKNPKKAIELLKKGGSLGDAESFYLLADRYEHGKEIPQSLKKAKKYYKKAIKLGDSNSMNNLGFLYQHDGKRISQNYKKAIKLYNQAIEKDNLDAMYNMANLYYEAHIIYEKAREKNQNDILSELKLIYSSPNDITENYLKAITLYWRAAQKNHVPSIYKLAHIALEGEGVAKDYNLAIRLYTQAAELGYRKSLKKLKYIYSGFPTPSFKNQKMAEKISLLLNFNKIQEISSISKTEKNFIGMCIKLFKLQDIQESNHVFKSLRKSEISHVVKNQPMKVDQEIELKLDRYFKGIIEGVKLQIEINQEAKLEFEMSLKKIWEICLNSIEIVKSQDYKNRLSETMILVNEMVDILSEDENCLFSISKKIFDIFRGAVYMNNKSSYFEMPFKLPGIQVYAHDNKYYASLGVESIQFSKKVIDFLNGEWINQGEFKKQEINNIKNNMAKVRKGLKVFLEDLRISKIIKLQKDDNLDQDMLRYLTDF